MSDHALGLDFGTNSVRALLVRCDAGEHVASAERGYANGVDGVVLDPRDPHLARQVPSDWIDALIGAVREVLATARERGVGADAIAGIGVDTTASTPLPVDAGGAALAEDPRFRSEPAALAWLWKDHTAHAEAEEITALAEARRPEYLARCGGRYSAEWFWAKILHCLRHRPEVFDAACSWVEACDWIPGWLTGRSDPRTLRRSACAAGHKALWAAEWGGLPDPEFLAELDPRLVELRARLYEQAFTSDVPAGVLCADAAAATGLSAGTPVAVGAIDAHLGAVGAGVRPGALVKVIGTSSCDMAVAEGDTMPDLRGLSGAARGSIVPGMLGFEAGQAAVGDLYAWCARHVGQRPLAELEAEAARLSPGQSGLLALDWHNGNRCVIGDQELTGLIIGLTLQSGAAEIYRAIVEATAFGARAIVEAILAAGVPVDTVIACGGIASKSPLVMQIHADVLGREVHVAPSDQACALGAAIMGAVAAGRHPDTSRAQAAMCAPPSLGYTPDDAGRRVYDELYELYRTLHDAFGRRGSEPPVGDVMKRLLALRRRTAPRA